MWRSKKFVVFALLAAVLLVGSISGIAFAQTGNGDDSQPEVRCGALLDKVCEIYEQKTGVGIEQEVLKEAFTEAQSEMRDEALDKGLRKLVDEGKISPDQADQYKAWLQAKPDTEPFRQQLKDWQLARPDISPELKEWQDARPDMPPPEPFGRFGGHGFQDGMKWGGGHHFWGRQSLIP